MLKSLRNVVQHLLVNLGVKLALEREVDALVSGLQDGGGFVGGDFFGGRGQRVLRWVLRCTGSRCRGCGRGAC